MCLFVCVCVCVCVLTNGKATLAIIKHLLCDISSFLTMTHWQIGFGAVRLVKSY